MIHHEVCQTRMYKIILLSSAMEKKTNRQKLSIFRKIRQSFSKKRKLRLQFPSKWSITIYQWKNISKKKKIVDALYKLKIREELCTA